jgi:two-component system response regulator MprA
MTKRILLVDDDRSIRESLSKILRAENYEVVLGENGEEAIEKHGVERVDLLILDLNADASGVTNAWTTLERLVGINPLLPLVIITGRSNQGAQAESVGADALMEKPLDVPLLLQTIRELLTEPMESRARRANNRVPSFRYVPCDNELFREMMRKRHDTPYPFPASKDE